MSTLEQHTIVIPTCNERENLALQAHAVVSQQAGDAAARFRGYRRAVLESIDLDEIESDGYSFLIGRLYQCQQRGWRSGKVPIIFDNRQQGTGKVSRIGIARVRQGKVLIFLDEKGNGDTVRGVCYPTYARATGHS